MGGPAKLCRALRDERTWCINGAFELRAVARKSSVQVSRILPREADIEKNVSPLYKVLLDHIDVVLPGVEPSHCYLVHPLVPSLLSSFWKHVKVFSLGYICSTSVTTTYRYMPRHKKKDRIRSKLLLNVALSFMLILTLPRCDKVVTQAFYQLFLIFGCDIPILFHVGSEFIDGLGNWIQPSYSASLVILHDHRTRDVCASPSPSDIAFSH